MFGVSPNDVIGLLQPNKCGVESNIKWLVLLRLNLACSKEQHAFAAAEDPRHTSGHQRRKGSCQQGS